MVHDGLGERNLSGTWVFQLPPKPKPVVVEVAKELPEAPAVNPVPEAKEEPAPKPKKTRRPRVKKTTTAKKE